ncbi:MAG TPA: radical SAM protein [Thermoanaerobaculia bacterium]|nr:radical SAM protein [Thermoanaerobaculia bacterium]
MSSGRPAHAAFPAGRAGRDRFVTERRGPKNVVDPSRPNGFFVEDEPILPGVAVPVATVLLANRECAFRCTMCDLWKDTLDAPTPKGAIPSQIRHALERLPAARRIKLYNAGSFFDRGAVPGEDHAAIAELVRGFERVVVECHPALAGDAVPRFRDLLAGPDLEVAMGLETANAEALEKLNKGMTTDDFASCTRRLVSHGIHVRSFVLVGVPFLARDEQASWLAESSKFSFESGCRTVSLIPMRLGNGTLEELHKSGQFDPPSLFTFEESFALALASRPPDGLVLADLWDAGRLDAPACCAHARIERLRSMNTFQRNLPFTACPMGRHDS